MGSLLRLALPAPSSDSKLVPGMRQIRGVRQTRQDLEILLQLFRRALDVSDHTYMHVNAHSCLHVCAHAHIHIQS